MHEATARAAMNSSPGSTTDYSGGCHCGAVRFRAHAAKEPEIERCNCSICKKSGYLHLIVPASRFTLECGSESLTTYTFNSGIAQHHFCRHCGIKAFYIPRSNPDGVDVNFNCLDDPPKTFTINEFDGQNWEANAASLAHKSKE